MLAVYPGSFDPITRGHEDLIRRGLVFADPPYTTNHASRIAALFRERPFARILGVEHDRHEDVGPGDHRRYGRTVLTFLEAP